MFYGGQPSIYATKLEEVYGKGKVAELEKKRQEIVKDFPFEEKIVYYENLLEKEEVK